ncbi:MAG: hypothetical protein ACYDDV_11460 [Methanoregula sp.]
MKWYTWPQTKQKKKRRDLFTNDFKNCPIPDDEIIKNLGLYVNLPLMQRLLWFHETYQKIINVHGIIMEFGCRWGQNLAFFETFRGIYEPYNFNRKIVGFDTFSGFPSVHEKDGKSPFAKPGNYDVTENYEQYLNNILEYQESEMHHSNIKKFEIVKGDASKTIYEYLDKNPETIIAFAYFDIDLYEPTKECLQAIKPHLTKGSIVAFDELNLHDFPGETLALNEVFGLNNIRIQRSPLNPVSSYFIVE